MTTRNRTTTRSALDQALAENANNQRLRTLRAKIDELGTLNAQLEPFEEILKKRDKAKEDVKVLMKALDIYEASGKLYEVERTVEDFFQLDQTLLADKLGDLTPYKRKGERNFITVESKKKKG